MLAQFGDDVFHPLFKLPAVSSASHHRRNIKRHNPLATQRTGFFCLDAQCQSFHDRRLAYTRLADKDRVVLFAAAENLYHALNLHFTTHHRIQLALFRQFGQIPTVFVQSRCGPFLGFLLRMLRLPVAVIHIAHLLHAVFRQFRRIVRLTV